MVDDPERTRIRDEWKWLDAQRGSVRDLDVAIERLKAADKHGPQATSDYEHWNENRADSHRHLARALRSARYRRLIESIFGWVENGPWSIKEGKQAAQERAMPIAMYSARKLTRWEEKILKKRPEASENGHQEATSAAADEQEAMLFDRGVRRPVSRQEIFQATSVAEVSAEGSKISRAVK